MLLDTTFLIDLLERDPDAVEKLDELVDSRAAVVISTLTVFEVGIGLETGERERFEGVVDSMTVLPPSLPETWRAVGIQRSLRERGEEIGVIDVLLAATAAGTDDPVVLTRNVDEFARVDSITVERY
jgi:predicted nucleic acid-binding protein